MESTAADPTSPTVAEAARTVNATESTALAIKAQLEDRSVRFGCLGLIVCFLFGTYATIVWMVGDGAFAAAVHVPAGDAPRSVAIGYLDADQVPDLQQGCEAALERLLEGKAAGRLAEWVELSHAK